MVDGVVKQAYVLDDELVLDFGRCGLDTAFGGAQEGLHVFFGGCNVEIALRKNAQDLQPFVFIRDPQSSARVALGQAVRENAFLFGGGQIGRASCRERV